MDDPRYQKPTQSNEYKRLLQTEPGLRAAVSWLEHNGFDPDKTVADALNEFRSRKQFPKWELRMKYARSVILGHFLRLWVNKHAGKSMEAIRAEGGMFGADFQALRTVIILIADERCFSKMLDRLSRKSAAEAFGVNRGDWIAFQSYVTGQVESIAESFVQQFDASSPLSTRASLKYLERMMVSRYLRYKTSPQSGPHPNVFRYMAQSTRMSDRTVLAFKMSYFPDSITKKEREMLLDEFGYQGPRNIRLKIKDVAKILGYPSGNTLSRKFYRIKEWFKNSDYAAHLAQQGVSS